MGNREKRRIEEKREKNIIEGRIKFLRAMEILSKGKGEKNSKKSQIPKKKRPKIAK